MANLENAIRQALMEFASTSLVSNWQGRREREAISLFAFRHLLAQIRPGSALYDPAQIAIEYPVPQVTEHGKAQVCKDLVIWARPAMTCWDSDGMPRVAPIAIFEWKFSVRRMSTYDIKWLQAFSRLYPGCVGYAVAANRPGAQFLLRCDRVEHGEVQPQWLNL